MSHPITKVFKAYDIRGLAPGELDAAFAKRLGQVLVELYKPKSVLVGRDMRISSPELEAALIEGLTTGGANVVRIGLCTTPMFNVSVGIGAEAYDLGVMVTASHNPGKYNGFKLVKGDATPIGQGSGMEEIRDRFMSDTAFESVAARGLVADDTKALAAYLDKVFSLTDVSRIPPMKIAVDAGNGMNGLIMPELAKRLPQCTFFALYWEPDGNFPHHEANPLKSETLEDLRRLVGSTQSAVGVAFDGDGDRVGFMDETGLPIPGDLMTALLAESLLASAPGSKILYDLRSSWATKEAIESAGGVPVMSRVGHAFIKRRMRDEGGLFAGELSMHYYFRDLWNVESGDLCLLLLLRLLAQTGKPLSALWKPLKTYAKTEEINSEVTDPAGGSSGAGKDAALRRIDEKYRASVSSVTDMDGLRMEFGVGPDGAKSPDAWWFSVRASNTEPLLRLIVEAVSEKVMAEKREELLQMLRA
ncbi:MAG TPA: phosphomannomutase/phosphoglucomutase [Candidatus Methylomirabilis sp.]|nr:phosphomannomutase/phosphoglucomutase [Candidatus Methylomirabilis sp.]